MPVSARQFTTVVGHIIHLIQKLFTIAAELLPYFLPSSPHFDYMPSGSFVAVTGTQHPAGKVRGEHGVVPATQAGRATIKPPAIGAPVIFRVNTSAAQSWDFLAKANSVNTHTVGCLTTRR